MTAEDLAGLERSAEISPCGHFRFSLLRRWGSGPMVAWLMLNPSTADATDDDPTLRRIMDWADRWGYHGVHVVNVFPFRSSKPAELWKWLADKPAATVGFAAAMRSNARAIQDAVDQSALRMVGFGADVAINAPDDLNRALFAFGGDGFMCLGTSQHGWPLHPMARGKLRLPESATPTFWHWPTMLTNQQAATA